METCVEQQSACWREPSKIGDCGPKPNNGVIRRF
jgi:hypothetical protein